MFSVFSLAEARCSQAVRIGRNWTRLHSIQGDHAPSIPQAYRHEPWHCSSQARQTGRAHKVSKVHSLIQSTRTVMTCWSPFSQCDSSFLEKREIQSLNKVHRPSVSFLPKPNPLVSALVRSLSTVCILLAPSTILENIEDHSVNILWYACFLSQIFLLRQLFLRSARNCF